MRKYEKEKGEIQRSAAFGEDFVIQDKSVNGRVFPGLFHFFVSLPCVVFRFSRSCRAWRFVLAVCFLQQQLMHGALGAASRVPSAVARAARSYIVPRFTSRGRGVSCYIQAVALVSRHASGRVRIAALRPAQAWTLVPPFEPARSPG